MNSFGKETILLLLAALIIVASAAAEPTAPPQLQVGDSERRDLGALPTQSVEAQAGNVSAVNVEMLSITQSWQGYYGNISGAITLDDGGNNTFYNWSIVTSTGEVFATRNSTIGWSGVDCTSAGERSSEESYLGHVAVDGDSVTNTFNTTDHPAFLVGAASISQDTCFSTNAFSGGSQDTSRFHQVLLSDASSNMVYTTLIDDDQVGFDGSNYDFQLLVGEDGHSGDTSPTTYYFWVELG